MLTEKQLISILVRNLQRDVNRIPVLDSDIFHSIIGSMRDAISQNENLNSEPSTQRYFIVYYFAYIEPGSFAHGNCVYATTDGDSFMNRESLIKELISQNETFKSLSITGYNEITKKEYETWKK